MCEHCDAHCRIFEEKKNDVVATENVSGFRRLSSSVYFYNRTWQEYDEGFGNLAGGSIVYHLQRRRLERSDFQDPTGLGCLRCTAWLRAKATNGRYVLNFMATIAPVAAVVSIKTMVTGGLNGLSK